MEEILASIRRIISEEEQGAATEEVLELTQAETPPAEAAPAEDDIVFETQAAAPEPEPAPAPEPAPPARAQAPVVTPTATVPAEPIIGASTASAAAGALSRLAGTLKITDTPGQTVEGVVRELLKPMLKEWLDRNLPAIVEARVEAELERIARLVR